MIHAKAESRNVIDVHALRRMMGKKNQKKKKRDFLLLM